MLGKVSFLVDVMCPRCNYLMASAITHIARRQEGTKSTPPPINVSQWKGIDFSLWSESNGALLYCKGISLKRCWDHMPRMHRAPFPKCKCEFELPRPQMQKLHQWSEFNDSPVFECVDNGHRRCTAQPFEAPTIHRRTAFAAETTHSEGPRVSTSWVVHVRSDDERWTGGDGCTPLRSVHMTACI